MEAKKLVIETSVGPGSASRPSVTILVPAYNEADHIVENLTRLYVHMEKLSGLYDWEILIVNDGSRDQTGDLVSQFAQSHAGVKFKSHRINLGLGRAITTGFRWSKADYVVTCDADLSYNPDHITEMLDTIVTTGASIVVASPYMTGGTVTGVPGLRAWLSRWANRFLGRLSLGRLATVTGMVRAYEGSFVRSLVIKSIGNQVNAEIIYKAQLLRAPIVEIPAHLLWTRDEADTKRRRLHFNMIRTIIDFAFAGFIFRPFFFFIIPGLIILLLAFYALGNVVYHVWNAYGNQSGGLDSRISGAFAHAFEASPHSFVVGGIATIVAVQLISLGVVSAQNKRYFEDQYHLSSAVYADREQRS